MGPTSLTHRQLEVFAVILVEGSRKCAAHRLGISESTVDTHLERAFRKTGTASFSQLVAWLDVHDQNWMRARGVGNLSDIDR